MQWGIVPRQAMPLEVRLEPGNEPFGQLRPRARRPDRSNKRDNPAGVPSRAATATERVLPRAGLATVQRALRVRSLLREAGSRASRRTGMSVLAKAAATTAELTDRSESGHFDVEFVVQGAVRSKLRSAAPVRRGRAIDLHRSFLTMAKEDRISVKSRGGLAPRRDRPPARSQSPASTRSRARGGLGTGGDARDRPCSQPPLSQSVAARLLDQAVAVPTSRTNRAENSSTVSPRNSASCWISSAGTTHTRALVQQAPQRVHENARPSRYHGEFRCGTLIGSPDEPANPVL